MKSKQSSPSRCTYRNACNHRCRMLTTNTHPTFCPYHAEIDSRERAASEIGAELATLSGEFKTASDLNHILGKLFHLLAKNRIDRRHAHTLAYIAQLLSGTLPNVKREIQATRGHGSWEQAVLKALLPRLPQPAPAAQHNPAPKRDSPPPRNPVTDHPT